METKLIIERWKSNWKSKLRNLNQLYRNGKYIFPYVSEKILSFVEVWYPWSYFITDNLFKKHEVRCTHGAILLNGINKSKYQNLSLEYSDEVATCNFVLHG